MNNSDFNEIDNYLNIPNDINADPLMWWKVNQRKYPILSLIAKNYLIIQLTSVPSKRAFQWQIILLHKLGTGWTQKQQEKFYHLKVGLKISWELI